jgi:hypothetical protein
VLDIILFGEDELGVGVWGATEQKTGLSTSCRQPLDRRDVNIERLGAVPLDTFPRPAGLSFRDGQTALPASWPPSGLE